LLEAAAAANVVAMPAPQYRFDAIIRIVLDMARSGDLGKLVLVRGRLECVRPRQYYINSTWRGSPQREGGSALTNQAYHIMDLLNWLAGPLLKVSAEMDTPALKGFIEIEDALTTSLTFANGAIGALSVTGAAGRGWASFIELPGTAGVVAFGIANPNRIRR
jgi:UDP-N-acetyl-2-amino-2-deoxyglucuronate dehydrogenase